MSKLATISVKGGEYARVADRLKEFRESNPKGKQESGYIIDDNGVLRFTVWLWRDKTELLDLMKAGITDQETLRGSADANGTAQSSNKGEKNFEKLESIALGRALANLGYLASGEIASYEEMEEFNRMRDDKREKERSIELENATKKLESSTNLKELQSNFMSLGTTLMRELVPLKDELKKKLGEDSENS